MRLQGLRGWNVARRQHRAHGEGIAGFVRQRQHHRLGQQGQSRHCHEPRRSTTTVYLPLTL